MDGRVQSIGEQIAAKAWEYVDTPWVHQGRVKGRGVDCIGLAICAVKEVEDFGYDNTRYSRDPNWDLLKSEMEKYSFCIASQENEQTPDQMVSLLEVGDILVFNMFNHPRHVGIYVGDDIFLHSYQSIGKVAPFPLVDRWKRRLFAVYRYRNER